MGESWELEALSKTRGLTNRAAELVVGLGGGAVILAIALIFFYLLWVVAPIFVPASIDAPTRMALTQHSSKLVDVSENGDALFRVAGNGHLEFYDAKFGTPLAVFSIDRPVTEARRVYPNVDLYSIRDESGALWFAQTQYVVNFNGDTRTLTPKLEFPFGTTPLAMPARTSAYDSQFEDGTLTLAAVHGNSLRLTQYRGVESGYPLRQPKQVDVPLARSYDHAWIGPRAQWVYLLGSDGVAQVIGIGAIAAPQNYLTASLLPAGTTMTAAAPLLGRYSIAIADSDGGIRQWVLLRDDPGYSLSGIRQFDVGTPAESIIVEPRRKGFATLDAEGTMKVLYPTSRRIVAKIKTELKPGTVAAISPRSDYLVAESAVGQIDSFKIHNEHPEISWGTLWAKVWYEGYPEPVYSWQSSSADNDFEPKFSLTPLAFGTLKAAFYALLFAVPIAIMGAIYTAYFMAPSMRALVKPGIEIMAALPTVILGFIGGLWLAPIIEANLSSVLGIFVVLPIGLFVFALLWWFLPERLTKPFAGWYGLLVVPLIIGMVAASFHVGPWLEDSLFGGNSRTWFRDVMGLDFDQRNALVVGLIMGLAVIPTIFSIAEDAIYGVPRHLSNGSLALGATPWQTLTRVVLLTASPGIFSAFMIGMGRAVGETMIVLMATGNTPLMNFNIFEGMRTFAANIAVELPESEVGSSHYRILFLAALVLFMITFAFNTVAEIVRQRLRLRYGSL